MDLREKVLVIIILIGGGFLFFAFAIFHYKTLLGNVVTLPSILVTQ